MPSACVEGLGVVDSTADKKLSTSYWEMVGFIKKLIFFQSSELFTLVKSG